MVNDWIDLARLLSAAILTVCAFQMLLLLSHSWHGIRPLRREVEASGTEVVTTPFGLTFAYNCVILGILVMMAITRVQLVAQQAPPNVSTFATPPLAIALTMVLSRILRASTSTLQAVRRQQRGLS